MEQDTAKSLEKRHAIIEAALDCFSQYGFDSTSMKMIAQASETKSAALIYYYFKDKDDLLMACMTDVAVPEIQDIPDDTDPVEWMVQIQADYLDMLAVPQFKKLILCAYSVISRRSDFLDAINARFRESHRLRFYHFLDVQINRGKLTPLHYWSVYQDIFYPLSMRMLISGDWSDWGHQPHYLEYLRQRSKRFLYSYSPSAQL